MSSRAEALAESETLRLYAAVARLKASGKDLVSLLEGEPDLAVPPEAARATIQAIRAGRTRYSDSSGLLELRSLIAAKLRETNGIPAAEENVLVTNGAKQALHDALQTLCGSGDDVIVPRPYWPTFPECVKLAGARPVFVATENHQLDVSAIAAAVTPRTKVVIVNSPNNPTGAVYPASVLRELLRLAAKKDFFVISDEAYEDLVYDELPHVSPASLSRDAARRTVSLFTFSKSYSMTGFRVGYVAAEAPVLQAMRRHHGHVTGNVCTFAQLGAVAALRLGPGVLETRRAAFERRRDLAFELASRLFPCVRPEGALYVFADARAYLGKSFKTSVALAEHLIMKAGVASVPGSAFGQEGCLRFSFSGPEGSVREGFRRVEEALRR